MSVFARSSISVLYMLRLPYSFLLLSSLICSAHTGGDPDRIPSNDVLFSRQLLRVVMWTRVYASSAHPLAATLASCSSWDSQTCCSGALCWDVLLCGPPLASVNLFRHQLPSGAYSDQIVTGPPCPRHFFHALWVPLALFCTPTPATPSTFHLLPL